MITKQTVLILGAGASKPYGYPVGEKLIDLIIGRTQLDSNDRRAIAPLLGVDVKEQTWTQSIQQLNQRFITRLQSSDAPSIDTFIHNHSDDVPFAMFGKAMICRALLNSTEHLFITDDPVFAKDNWYKELWHSLSADVGKDHKRLLQNKLTIITFNYDTSLERYLTTVILRNYPGADEAFVEKFFKTIPILHVYGKIDQHFNGRNSVPLTREIVNGVSTFTESTDDGLRNTISDYIMDASTIYFMGFGYVDLNMKLLFDFSRDLSLENKHINGACYGLTERRINEINRTYFQTRRFIDPRNKALMNRDFFREHFI